MFADALEMQLSAGDVFPPHWDDDRPEPLGSVVVFSHGCDIDKSPTVLVASYVPEAETDKGLLGDIKKGRVWHALYLENCKVPGWVNLRTLRNVPKEGLINGISKRLQSMTEDGHIMLSTKVFQYLTRTLPKHEQLQGSK